MAGPLPRLQVTLRQDIQNLDRRLRKTVALSSRLLAQKARTNMRDWVKVRRERTRHLIELGGLVQKAGLVELVDDDRATLLGAFLELAARLHREGQPAEATAADLRARWRRRGLRAFDADKKAMAAMGRREEGQSGASA